MADNETHVQVCCRFTVSFLLEIPFFEDIVRCLVVYTYANDNSDAFEHDS